MKQTNKPKIEHLFINLIFINEQQDFVTFFSYFEKEFQTLRNDYHLVVKTIYLATNDNHFLTDQQLSNFLVLIKNAIGDHLVEYSYEIGYHNLKANQLEILKSYGVNRLVWKIRTFNNDLLQKIDDRFDNKILLNLLEYSCQLGFKNFSLDLEDNLKLQTEQVLIADLNQALVFNPPHISYQSNDDYHNIANKKIIREFLEDHNYHNYEFFSFACTKKDYSQQSLAYLKLKNWYGLGPNAGSFIVGNDDQVMTINNTNEIDWQKIKQIISKDEFYQLILIQGLMLKKGIKLEGEKLLAFNNFAPTLNKLIAENKLEIKDNILQVTKQGWTLLNEVLIDIIKV